MRNSKIVALVATAALLVLGAAFTSFAATYTWYQVDGIWHCKDKSGDDYTQAFAKSGSDIYWLDENGEMATDLFLEEDGNYYYFDETGKMLKNDWHKVENDDDEGDEYYWYYFQNSGKAIKGKNKPVSVTGKKYLFTDDAKMLYGWTDGNAFDDADSAWTDAKYYCGDADDGAVRFGWQQADVIDAAEDLEEQTYWFYFGTNGIKTAATATKDPETGKDRNVVEKTINGKKYVFDSRGVMKAEWVAAATTESCASASISAYYRFQTVEDGSKIKKGWFRVVPQAQVNATANEDDEDHWFYAVGGGEIAKDCVKTIKGKKYGFNSKGEMVSGLWTVDDITAVNGDFDDDANCIDTEGEVSDLTTSTDEKNVYFFGDEETDGAMKTGTVTTEIDGDDYTFYFGTTGASKYLANNGWKKNAYYVNGSKLKADADYRYQLFEALNTGSDVQKAAFTALGATGCKLDDIQINPTGIKDVRNRIKSYTTASTVKYVLVSSSGSFVKNATVKKDADGFKFTVSNYLVTKVE